MHSTDVWSQAASLPNQAETFMQRDLLVLVFGFHAAPGDSFYYAIKEWLCVSAKSDK